MKTHSIVTKDESSGQMVPTGQYVFFCPGCNEHHVIKVPGWTFNGNFDKPTITPSILVRGGHYAPGWKEGDNCWCTYNKKQIEEGKEPSSFKCDQCHSFVTDGKIQFLADCSHSLANQTVDLPDLDLDKI